MVVTKLMCIICGKPTLAGKEIIEKIDGREDVFDKEHCVILFKKLKSVYGNEFYGILNA